MMELPSTPPIAEPERASRLWVALCALACLLIVLGALAISSLVVSALAFVFVLGWLLIVGGVLQIAGALLFRRFGVHRAEIVFGLLSVALGAIMLWAPVASGSLIGLVLVGGLILDAVSGGLLALRARYPGWRWLVLFGLIGLAFAVSILLNPVLLLAALGLLVGLNLLMHGAVLLLVALEARRLSQARPV